MQILRSAGGCRRRRRSCFRSCGHFVGGQLHRRTRFAEFFVVVVVAWRIRFGYFIVGRRNRVVRRFRNAGSGFDDSRLLDFRTRKVYGEIGLTFHHEIFFQTFFLIFHDFHKNENYWTVRCHRLILFTCACSFEVCSMDFEKKRDFDVFKVAAD